ncbi:MAG: MATE family efflux transporter [Treponema sp.]|nr:MATE family efflux transporter [Treponema sp.]
MRLLALAVPLILSNIINQGQMLIDRIFLGHADALYMSVLGNATFPIWTTMAVCFSISTGASILISQNVGAKNSEKVEEYAGSLLKYNNILPIVLFFLWFFCSQPVFVLMGVSDSLMPLCVDYARYYSPVFLLSGLCASITVIFQTSNLTKHLAVWSFLRSVTNVFLDWVLIFGEFGFPKMGVKGAALGTTIAEFLGGVYIAVAFIRSTRLTTRPKGESLRKSKVTSYLHSARLGINTALEDFLWNIGNLAIIRILNTINELAAGVYSIIFGVELLAVVVVGSLGSATLTLTGEATGRRDVRQFKGVCLIAYSISFVLALVMVAIGILFPKQILSVFTKDASIIASSGVYLMFVGINFFSKSGNIIIGSGIRGSGDTKWMFLTQIFGTCFVTAAACLFVFLLHLGFVGVFFAIMADEGVRCLINLVRYLNICKNSKIFALVDSSDILSQESIRTKEFL